MKNTTFNELFRGMAYLGFNCIILDFNFLVQTLALLLIRLHGITIKDFQDFAIGLVDFQHLKSVYQRF